MAENLVIALQITVIGMGLVFASILLLWGMMAALVRLTADHEAATPDEPIPAAADLSQLRAQAAAVAVAVALQTPVQAEPAPQTTAISAWQSVMRGRQLRQRGAIR